MPESRNDDTLEHENTLAEFHDRYRHQRLPDWARARTGSQDDISTSASDPGKKARRDALVGLLETYVHELQAIDAITNTDERRLKCSSAVVRIFESLSAYLDDKEIGQTLAEIASLTQHCFFFFRRPTPTQEEQHQDTLHQLTHPEQGQQSNQRLGIDAKDLSERAHEDWANDE